MSEPCRLRRGEGYGACVDDAVQVRGPHEIASELPEVALGVGELGGVEGGQPELVQNFLPGPFIGPLINANFHGYLSFSRCFFFLRLTS